MKEIIYKLICVFQTFSKLLCSGSPSPYKVLFFVFFKRLCIRPHQDLYFSEFQNSQLVYWDNYDEEMIYLAYTTRSQSIAEGNQGRSSKQETEAETMEECCSWLAHLMLRFFFL